MMPNTLSLVTGITGLIFGATSISAFIPILRRTALARSYNDTTVVDDKKVSVVIYSHNSADKLPELIASISKQDYPNFEIIVVDDGSTDNTTDVLERLAIEEPRLHHTFVPENPINLSRRKLAITLGIKASTGEVIITTDATCQICSEQWISLMASHFQNRDIDLVLGYTSPMEDHERGHLYRTFDFLLTSAQWISAAEIGQPFRGDSRNMAYRREIFFAHNGFGSNIWTHYGEDDLFISEFATHENTITETSPKSILRLAADSCGRKAWNASKERSFFTSRYLHTRAYWRNALGGWSLLISTVLLSVSAVYSLPSLYCALIALIYLIGMFSLLIVNYRKVQKRLLTGNLALSIIPFFYIKPVVDACKAVKFSERRKFNFTWQR